MKQKGITLIALVITIIVLLILTGVILKAIVRDNGILLKSESTVIESDTVQAKELIQSELARRMDKDGLYTNSDVIDAVKQVTDNYVEEMAKETTTKNGNSFSIADLWVPTEIELPEIPDDIPFIPVESEEGDTIFDISKGNITIGESYEGTNFNGNISKGDHQLENKYYITQSTSGMINDVTIENLMGNPIHIDDLVINNKGIEPPTPPENPTPSEEPGPNDIVFDISRGNIEIGYEYPGVGNTYSGKDKNGEPLWGAHQDGIRYWITQSDPSRKTTNTIKFCQDSPELYTVVLDNVNMGDRRNSEWAGNDGQIIIEGYQSTKNVCIQLKGENIVENIRYNSEHDFNSASKDTLKITSYYGDGSIKGKLYIPEKIESQEEIEKFVRGKTNYNHWNAGIGAYDSPPGVADTARGIIIAGGDIQVLTSEGDNCTAIGGGGNELGEVTITGGKIKAITNGTGSAIGGGIGWGSPGGKGIVNIEGGEVYAENYGIGTAIGGGSSYDNEGSAGEVNITGGNVIAKSVKGTAIGGGSSEKKQAGKGQITINGGTVTANAFEGVAIGGGSARSYSTVYYSESNGGDCDITINGGVVTAISTKNVALGGGESDKGKGGDTKVTIHGGVVRSTKVGGGWGKNGSKNGTFTLFILPKTTP